MPLIVIVQHFSSISTDWFWPDHTAKVNKILPTALSSKTFWYLESGVSISKLKGQEIKTWQRKDFV